MLANIHIDDDRTKAIQNTLNTSGLIIYTDGSGFKHGIGAATIVVKNGTTFKKLKYYLGSDISHTVYEAEAMTITLTLHLACSVKERRLRLTIGTDNQAVLLGLKNQRSKPSHYLLNQIHSSLKDFQNIQAKMRGVHLKGYRRGTSRTRLPDSSTGQKEWNLKQCCKVTFIWTPGHEGIDGNKAADVEAKLAAQGESSPPRDLPPFLCKKALPISILATQQELKKKAKFRWLSEWLTSPCL